MSTFGCRLPALVAGVEPKYLTAVSEGEVPEQIARAIQQNHPGRRWRRRQIPPEVAFWFVLSMGLWRSVCQAEVWKNLCASWTWMRVVTDSALAHARKRLGAGPLRSFFEWTALRAVPAPSFRGHRVYALDGVRVDVPDTSRNARAFGRPGSTGKSRPFPQLLLLVLSAVQTRCLRAASIHPSRTGERQPALRLLDLLQPGDLLLLDCGFYSVQFLEELVRRGISYIVRLPASLKNIQPLAEPRWFEICTRYLPEGKKRRKKGPSRVIRIQGHVVRYTAKGKSARLLTNLRLRPREIIDTYRRRWEIETAFDEIKTHVGDAGKGKSAILVRSKSPELVGQELYALLALYNLLRLQMASAAARVHVVPNRMSLVASLNVLRRAVLWPVPSTPHEARRANQRLIEELAACLLDRPRRPRLSPRVVRKPARGYPVKRRHHRCRPFDFEGAIRLAAVS
jgi:hypothetical protein